MISSQILQSFIHYKYQELSDHVISKYVNLDKLFEDNSNCTNIHKTSDGKMYFFYLGDNHPTHPTITKREVISLISKERSKKLSKISFSQIF